MLRPSNNTELISIYYCYCLFHIYYYCFLLKLLLTLANILTYIFPHSNRNDSGYSRVYHSGNRNVTEMCICVIPISYSNEAITGITNS